MEGSADEAALCRLADRLPEVPLAASIAGRRCSSLLPERAADALERMRRALEEALAEEGAAGDCHRRARLILSPVGAREVFERAFPRADRPPSAAAGGGGGGGRGGAGLSAAFKMTSRHVCVRLAVARLRRDAARLAAADAAGRAVGALQSTRAARAPGRPRGSHACPSPSGSASAVAAAEPRWAAPALVGHCTETAVAGALLVSCSALLPVMRIALRRALSGVGLTRSRGGGGRGALSAEAAGAAAGEEVAAAAAGRHVFAAVHCVRRWAELAQEEVKWEREAAVLEAALVAERAAAEERREVIWRARSGAGNGGPAGRAGSDGSGRAMLAM